MNGLTRRFVERLVACRWWLLGLAALLMLISIRPSGHVQFDRSIENMFAPGDPLLNPYLKLKRTFGGNELVLAVYEDRDLLHPDKRGIRRLQVISQRCEQVPGVRAVLSLDRPMGDSIVADDSDLAIDTRRLFEKYTHGSDGKTVAVVCMLESEQASPVPRRQTIDALRAIMCDLPDGLQPGLLGGEPVLVEDGFRYLEQDGRRLGIWSTILLGATILLCFRSLRWVLIPLAVVQCSLVFTRALMVWLDLQLTMVSSMLTALVTVIGVATVVHIIVRFREATLAGKGAREALVLSLSWCALPVTFACLTDAVGFGSLLMARVRPLQDFGLMMALASMVVLGSVFLLVPALALIGRNVHHPRMAWGEGGLGQALQHVLTAVRRRPRTMGLMAILLTMLATAGSSRLEVETDFTKNFRRGSLVVQSYEYIETNLSGAGVFDVIVPAPPVLDWTFLRKVRQFETRLQREVVDPSGQPALTKKLSLADSVARLESVRAGVVRNAMLKAALEGMRVRLPEFSEALYAEDPDDPGQHYLRVMLRASERQPAVAKRQIISTVERLSLESFPARGDRPAAQVTGFFVLLTNLVESILRDQWLTFVVATVGIALMMVGVFRSVPQALVALVPNGFPILIILGVMGWLDIPINMGTAMIAAVSMGLSVDSSIHYIVSFQRGLRDGKSVDEALDDVQQSVGRAMVLSTAALVVGFSVLCGSEFIPTVYFGVLMSLTMLGGLLGNLVVLPLLLRVVVRAPKSTTAAN